MLRHIYPYNFCSLATQIQYVGLKKCVSVDTGIVIFPLHVQYLN